MDTRTLHENDIESWAEAQVAVLRRLSTSSGPWSNLIDWENVIEEIEDLGSKRRRSAKSLLELVFVHLLKLHAHPASLSSTHWEREVREFICQARGEIERAMRARIDLDAVWRKALWKADNALSAYGTHLPEGMSQVCPYSFDELIDPAFDPLADARLADPGRDRP